MKRNLMVLSICAFCCCTPQAVVASVDTALCILNVYGTDRAKGLDDTQMFADIIVQCGTDAATIARVLDAHRAAEVKEGMFLSHDAGGQ